LIVNSFSKNVLGHNKKYLTNRKIGYAKNSLIKTGHKINPSISQYSSSKSASVVNL